MRRLNDSNRAISLLIASMMVLSSFVGVSLIGTEPVDGAVPMAAEDLLITDYQVRGDLTVGGNVVIANGGTLEIINGGLSFQQDYFAGDDFTLTIEDGGKLIMRNSELTTPLGLGSNMPSLGILVRNGGSMELYDSTLTFSGHMLFDSSTLYMEGSTITGHESSAVSASCNNTFFPATLFDDAPVLTFISSDVSIIDSSIDKTFSTEVSPDIVSAYMHDYGFAVDGPGRDHVIYSVERTVSSVATADDTGQALENITMEDDLYYVVEAGETMAFDAVDIAGLLFSAEDAYDIVMYASFMAPSGYHDGVDSIAVSLNNGTSSIATVGPTTDTSTTWNSSLVEESVIFTDIPDVAGFDLSSIDLETLEIEFQNTDPTHDIMFNRVWFVIEFEVNAYRNITLLGDTQLTAIDSYIDVDNAYDDYGHNALELYDQTNAYLYGVIMDTDNTGPSFTTAVSINEQTMEFYPETIGSNDNSTSDITDLREDNSNFVAIGPMEVMEVTGYNVGSLNADLSTSDFWANTSTSALYDHEDAYIQWSLDGAVYHNTSISPTLGAGVEENQNPLFDLTSTEQLSTLNTLMINPDEGINSSFIFSVWVEATITPSAYVYRWLDLSVTDSDGVYIEGADIDITTQSVEAVQYYTPDGVTADPPAIVLDYLGRTISDYMVTDVTGTAIIPLLTDVFDDADSNLALPSGGYYVNISYLDPQGIWKNSTDNLLDFQHYPVMDADSIYSSMAISFDGVVSSGLLLEDEMELTLTSSYRVAGNIIVRDNATLLLESCTLRMIQTDADEFGIYLSDSASLIMIDSELVSGYSLSIQMSGDANLILDGSSIDAMIDVMLIDDGSLTLFESTIGGNVSSGAGSEATLTVTDSTIGTLFLSGDSSAVVINSAIATLSLDAGATVIHYRWLTVAVVDGAGNPLSDAWVGIQYTVNDTEYGTYLTDAEGTVRVAALCEVFDSSGGPTFLGNYQLNSTFWYDGEAYDLIWSALGNRTVIDISLNHSSPNSIQKIEEIATLKLVEVLPDLSVDMAVSNVTPYRTEVVNITANVTNSGIIAASDVEVAFYENGIMFSLVTLESIAPNETVQVQLNWTATYPLGLHNLSVVVDPDNLIIESYETNQSDYVLIDVIGIAELTITQSDVTIVPSSITTNSTGTLTAVVHNLGDVNAPSFVVEFYDNDVKFDERTVSNLLADNQAIITVAWTPSYPGDHTISVKIDTTMSVDEVTEDNNEVDVIIKVNDYADMVMVNVGLDPAWTTIAVGENLTLQATVANDGQSTVSNVVVEFWLNSIGNGTLLDTATISSLSPGGDIMVTGSWTVTISEGERTEETTIWAFVNPIGPSMVPETDRTNNNGSIDVTIIDTRPDFNMISISLSDGDVAITEASAGQTIIINCVAENIGLSSALSVPVRAYAMDAGGNVTWIGEMLVDFGLDGPVAFNFTWMVNTSVGNQSIVIEINPDHDFEESDYTDDVMERTLLVTDAPPRISINISVFDYKSDTTIFVNGRVVNDFNGQPLKGVTMVATLHDAAGNIVSYSTAVVTNDNGYYSAQLYIPAGEQGDYSIEVVGDNGAEESTASVTITVEGSADETMQPWWVWVLIIVIVAAIIIGFSFYLYRYGLGRMVECGECGSMIPEASKRCPNCGVEFETGTAKCSECGAWIPADSTNCPECGAVFLTVAIDEEEDEYIKSMRRQYEEILDGYRDQARAEMGNKYSEPKFLTWWKKNPMYISFEDWMAKEEEDRKKGAFPCPHCGILNPNGSKVCHKCGTMFEMLDDESAEIIGKRVVVSRGTPPEEAEGGTDAGEPAEETSEADEPEPAAEDAGEGSIEEPLEKRSSLKRIVRKKRNQVKPKEGEEESEEDSS